jgi:hypothetical protein
MHCAGLNTAASVALSCPDGEEQSLTAGQQNLFDLASLKGGVKSAEIFFVFHSVSFSCVLSMISCLSSDGMFVHLYFRNAVRLELVSTSRKPSSPMIR